MSNSCNGACDSCGETCADRKQTPESFLEKPHDMSHIRHVIGVVSGKGGVGKSLVTSMLATLMQRRGHTAAILDADVTGPSIPKAFGLKRGVTQDASGLYPAQTKMGIRVMSVNLLMEKETAPVVWRGPIIANTVSQFWKDVIWSDVDYMFVDMPPGTGDVPLTVFQTIPLDGIVIVTSPQSLVEMIVEKAVNMAGMMHIPILGFVENMSFLRCPDCGKELSVFGESRVEALAAAYQVEQTARIPIVPDLAKVADGGLMELFEGDWLEAFADHIEATLD
ncbi:Mrp/NBP35 family ATP-binding protein [Oscillospiraceae bacterium OttesenSCG-928-F05]|nr:Mrp/NBP35 family ATP-binding protein [Oscillospiraceae bacterium OttesenSCG-928-F05]